MYYVCNCSVWRNISVHSTHIEVDCTYVVSCQCRTQAQILYRNKNNPLDTAFARFTPQGLPNPASLNLLFSLPLHSSPSLLASQHHLFLLLLSPYHTSLVASLLSCEPLTKTPYLLPSSWLPRSLPSPIHTLRSSPRWIHGFHHSTT